MNLGLIIRRVIWYLMNLSSALFVASLYLVKCQIELQLFEYKWINILLSYTIFFGVPIMLSIVFISLAKKTCSDDSLQQPVQKVSSANKEYLPVYLSYFFVSLSIPGDVEEGIAYGVLVVFILIIWIFTSLTTTYYFNPLLLLMRYKFYNVTSNNGIELFVISRRVIQKNETNITFPKLKKLTEIVYIEI